MSGNVAEWLNDSVIHTALRAYKGGSFRETESQLNPEITNAARAAFGPLGSPIPLAQCWPSVSSATVPRMWPRSKAPNVKLDVFLTETGATTTALAVA